MSTDTPTGADGPTSGPGATDRDHPAGLAPAGRTAREIRLAAEVAALETELARRDRRLEALRESYESLLETQARAGREADAFVWSDGRSSFEHAPSPSGLLARLRARLPST